tara:strand:- start:1170 stop:1742 length:573 start_codon:yes stop_codon:yes gene_type:complete
MDPFIGEVKMFGGNFAPRGWAFCEGQLLAIAQNQALFSILGTTYGGDGRTTFALPDLRGRAPIGPGTGPGLSTRRLGQRSGTETNVLTVNQMPSHNHSTTTSLHAYIPVNAEEGNEDEVNPAAGVLANNGQDNYASEATPNAFYNGANLAPVNGTVQVMNNGGSQPFNNMQPFLGVYYIIALVGVFPSRG